MPVAGSLLVMTRNHNAAKAQNPVDVFDRAAVLRFKTRAAPNIGQHNFLFDWALENIMERLALVKKDFPCCVIGGARQSPPVTEKLRGQNNIQKLRIMDSAPSLLEKQSSPVLLADDEWLPFADDTLDLFIQNLGLHSVNDLPGALIQINRALKPDGLFIGAMFGGDTLIELRQVLNQAELVHSNGLSPRIAPFADKQQMGGLMQRAGFALPVIDSDTVTVTYDNMFKLLEDIRGMGESNAITARHKSPLPRAVLMNAAELYQQQFSEADGRIHATFEIIFLLGWAPHDSQQKPQRPGSANKTLADALATEEIKTGETAKP